jgi:hypothetical protein
MAVSMAMVSSADAFDDGDWQLWNTESLEGALSEDTKVKFEEEFRFGGDIEELYYHHADIGISHSVTQWFSVGVNYRQVYEVKAETWIVENRPHVNTTFAWRFGSLKVQDRVRFEYRVNSASDDAWRYRNKVSAKPDWKPVSPYLSDEIFYDPEEGELNRNRVCLGVAGTLWRVVKGDLFYMIQSSKKHDEWSSYNIIGIKLAAGF